jgi:membrane protein implicated in regulation of membrane protease activity
MEAMVGATATVAEWEDGHGSVVVGGTRWTAEGPLGLRPGDHVVVTGTTGLSLRVEVVASRHG